MRLSTAASLPCLVCVVLLGLSSGACSSEPQASDSGGADADIGAEPDAIPSQSGKLKLLSISPSRGPLSGGGQVDLKGQDFADDARVFVGGQECEIAWRGGTTHIYAIVPPALMPAAVDVTVQSGVDSAGAPRVVGLTRGYSYLGETHVFDFAPAQGPLMGGTQLTVHGSGFRPGDKLLVGWREATNSQVIDEGTIVGLTPPGPELGQGDTTNAVVAVRHASGVAVLDGAFVYGRVPTIAYVAPGVVPTAGAPVTLHGKALGHATSLFAGGLSATLTPGTASGVRGAAIPGMATLDANALPGTRDMLVDSVFGASQLAPAFAYASGSALQVLGVAPASGSTAGGALVAALVNLPAGAKVQGVSMGGQPATLTLDDGAVLVTVPPHAAGPVDVVVTTDAGQASLSSGFLYVDQPVLDQVLPPSGPPEGGTAVSLYGSFLHEDCAVRFGTWNASVEGASADGGRLDVISPPGALGTVDVAVTCSGLVAHKTAGFEYSDGSPHINAVVPAQGATGGGSPVTLYGSGFAKGMKFMFGGKPALAISVIDGGHAEMLTPAHDGGFVDVTVILSGKTDTLLNGYNFFNPTASDGGTWGEQVGGTLNVTVLDIYQQQPIPDATVVLGQPGQSIYPKYVGVTDAAGQVVFHGPDVVGPISVSASKIEYTATSIVSFDARNATLLLFPYKPPSGSGGEPPISPPNPLLLGRVRDIDKYVSVPPANCLKSSELGDKTCDLCTSTTECTDIGTGPTPTSSTVFACIDNGPAGKRCLPDCTQANVCAKGFACFAEPSWPGHAVCKPELGIRKVFCATSQRDRGTPNAVPPGAAEDVISGVLPYDAVAVDEATGDYRLTGRLDELAIVCVGGYVRNDDQVFVPTAMGVRRHVFPQPYYKPGDEVAHLDIQLNIPLTRTLPVRLDHPQAFFPSSEGGTQTVSVWFDFGSDGTVQLLEWLAPGGLGFSGVKDELLLDHLPLYLPEELTDTKWALEGLVKFAAGAAGISPEQGSFHRSVEAPGDHNVRVRGPDGLWTFQALGQSQDMTGVLAGDAGDALLVSRSGKIYRGTLAKLKQIWQPPIYDPYETPVAVLAAAGTPSDATLVGQDGLIRRVQGTKVVQESGASTQTLRAVCQGPGLRVAVGDGGAMQMDVGNGWQTILLANPGDSDAKLPLRAVVCAAGGAMVAGVGGRILRVDLLPGTNPGEWVGLAKTVIQDPNATWNALAIDDAGNLWAGGEMAVPGGTPLAALWKQSPGQNWGDAWPGGAPLNAIKPLTSLVNMGSSGLLAVDREGGQWRVDPEGVHSEAGDRLDLRPRAGALISDGTVILVGQPGMWLGPFLTVPALNKPEVGKKSSPIEVSWTSAPGTAPTCNRVHMDGSGFPFWWIYAAAEVTAFVLPNFGDVGGTGIQPFPTGGSNFQWTIRVDRIFVPGMTINGFSTFDLEFGDWRSWSTNGRAFTP